MEMMNEMSICPTYLLSCNLYVTASNMSLYLDTLARTSAPELARRGRVCAALAVTEGGRRDSVTAARTRPGPEHVLGLVAAHKQQTQHFQCFHNNS